MFAFWCPEVGSSGWLSQALACSRFRCPEVARLECSLLGVQRLALKGLGIAKIWPKKHRSFFGQISSEMLCRKMCRAQRLHENPSFWNGLPSRVVSEAPLAARKAFEVKSRLVPFSWLERPLGRRCGSTGPVRLVVVYWQLGVPAIRHFLVERGSQNFEEWRVLIGWAGDRGEGEGKGQRGFPKN